MSERDALCQIHPALPVDMNVQLPVEEAACVEPAEH